MKRAWFAVRAAATALALALCTPPAWAFDPLTLFLLRIIRDQTISSSIESGVAASQRPDADRLAPPPSFAPFQPTSESQQLKLTIDESFIHLGPQQRAELHASLMRILNDPKNADVRNGILSEFKAQALALRNSQRMISQLSESDMRVVAANARAEYERLPPEQRQQLLQALQNGVPGMPRTLQDLMVAEFSSVPSAR